MTSSSKIFDTCNINTGKLDDVIKKVNDKSDYFYYLITK